LARSIRDALLTMPETPDGRAILATLRLDGFVAALPDLFDSIAALSKRARAAG
jgi:ABC-type phosphate/phosphonate transport system substrate-binding protein